MEAWDEIKEIVKERYKCEVYLEGLLRMQKIRKMQEVVLRRFFDRYVRKFKKAPTDKVITEKLRNILQAIPIEDGAYFFLRFPPIVPNLETTPEILEAYKVERRDLGGLNNILDWNNKLRTLEETGELHHADYLRARILTDINMIN